MDINIRLYKYTITNEKGKWNKKIKNSLINKYGYKINDVRKVMTTKEQIYYDIKLNISINYYNLYNKILIHFI